MPVQSIWAFSSKAEEGCGLSKSKNVKLFYDGRVVLTVTHWCSRWLKRRRRWPCQWSSWAATGRCWKHRSAEVLSTGGLHVVTARTWSNRESRSFVSADTNRHKPESDTIFIYYICFSAQPRATASYDVILHMSSCECVWLCLCAWLDRTLDMIFPCDSSVGYKLNFALSVTSTCSYRILMYLSYDFF